MAERRLSSRCLTRVSNHRVTCLSAHGMDAANLEPETAGEVSAVDTSYPNTQVSGTRSPTLLMTKVPRVTGGPDREAPR